MIPKSLEAFDPVEQSLVTGKRDATTVPTQSLYLLNSTFVRQQSLALAEHLLAESKEAKRIERAYLLVLARQPNKQEIARAQEFLARYQTTYEQAPPPVIQVAARPAALKIEEAKTDAVPVNPDDIDRTDESVIEDTVQAKDAKTAAWLNFAQALYASAEFRFVR